MWEMLTMLIILTMWTMLTMTIKMLETGGSAKCGGQSESCEQNTLTELYWSSPSLLANIRKNITMMITRILLQVMITIMIIRIC